MTKENPLGVGKEDYRDENKKGKISPLSVGHRHEKDENVPAEKKSNPEEEETKTEKDSANLDSESK